jgi:hypothetical protein
MHEGVVKAVVSTEWCLIDFGGSVGGDSVGKIFLKIQGEPDSIPWKEGEEVVLMSRKELEDMLADARRE